MTLCGSLGFFGFSWRERITKFQKKANVIEGCDFQSFLPLCRACKARSYVVKRCEMRERLPLIASFNSIGVLSVRERPKNNECKKYQTLQKAAIKGAILGYESSSFCMKFSDLFAALHKTNLQLQLHLQFPASVSSFGSK